MRKDREEKYRDFDMSRDLTGLTKGKYHFFVIEYCCACFTAFTVEVKEKIIAK